MKRMISVMFCLVLFTYSFSTDISKIKFEYLTVDDGLSQGIIEDITQDTHGFMWFATRDGLNRYDGLKFTIFRNDVADPNSLASSFVYCVTEDTEGKIWIGSSGLNVYDPVKNRMKRIEERPSDPESFQGGRVYNIKTDTDGTLWICTTMGLVHYFPSTGKFHTYKADGKNGSIGVTSVFSVCVTRDNRLYIAPSDDMIYEFDRKTGTFESISYKIAYFGNNATKYITEGSNGLLYITSEFAGVHIYDPKTGTSSLLDKGVGKLNVTSVKTRVLEAADDELWIGTDGGGINIFNPSTGAVNYIISDPKITKSLSGNAIFKMYKDRDGNIWVGHYGTGLSVYKRNKEKFTSYIHNPFNSSSINKEVVTAIFEDSKGRIWIGQDGGGLSLFNEQTKSFDHIRRNENDPASLTSDIILTINEDPGGNLLLGTYMGGFMVYDADRKKVIKSFNTGNGIPSNHIWMIYPDKKQRYWVTFLGSGYGVYDAALKSFEVADPNGPLACGSVIMNVTESEDGKIWLGSESEGFSVLDWENRKVTHYRHDDNNFNTVSYNDIKAIVLEDNYAWIATNGGGLNRLDLKSDSFKVYTMADGLSSNALMSMMPDHNGNLWISSTRGITKFNTSTGETENFDKTQGLQGSEFKYNAQCLLRDGRMIFGGVNGITLFHPDSINKSKIIPNVVFTDFLILNQSVIPGQKGSPLKSHINFTDRIVLNHRQSVFTIEFASLDYNSPSKNRFMYKLEGFDDDWIDAGNRRFVTYTNLDAGRYTFLLKGSNSDGVWNENIRKITIRVRPPWYSTKVSIAFYIIALLAGIRYLVRRREKQSIQDKLILEQKIKEAQAELVSKTRKVEEHEEEIKQRNETEKDIRFLTEGVAKLSEIIARKRRNLEELSGAIISELIRYTNASAGGIFVLDDSDPQTPVLRATGEFCLSSDKNIRFAFEPGEGNVGACFADKQILESNNLPDGYIILKSGLGSISLHYAVFVPIMLDNDCVGVIEIASVEKLGEVKIKLIEKAAESLASIITIIKANEKASHMLEQNNVQAEELKAQEEEMRQNMEELLATQEETQRREKGLLEQMQRKEARISELEKELSKLKQGSNS